MTWVELSSAIGLALDTVREHKMRSFLTVLGVIIGTGTIIGVGSIIAGLDGAVTGILRSFGTNTAIIFKFPIGFQSRTSEMLRRKPTAITLTTEDIANYEDTRAREAEARQREQAALQAQQNAQGQANNQNMRNPNDELRPLPGDRARTQQQIKTREERLGLGLGLGGGSSRS